MSVHIRLQRKEATHRPFYHLVAADRRSPRDGKYLEKLGYYDPNVEPSTVVVKSDRIQHWYNEAQLTSAASKLLKSSKDRARSSRSREEASGKVAAEPKVSEKTTEASTKKASTKKASTKKLLQKPLLKASTRKPLLKSTKESLY